VTGLSNFSAFSTKAFMFRSLDYLYVPARDIEASIQYYTGVLGGELVWKIHKFGAWVANVRLSQTGPLVLLTDHLEGGNPLLIYQVENLAQTAKELKSRGWSPESGPFEIPNGPCYPFRDPAGVRLAIYENERPDVDERFKGQFDS
jgi:predicted enzyme related to lactoylglutathione lyase